MGIAVTEQACGSAGHAIARQYGEDNRQICLYAGWLDSPVLEIGAERVSFVPGVPVEPPVAAAEAAGARERAALTS